MRRAKGLALAAAGLAIVGAGALAARARRLAAKAADGRPRICLLSVATTVKGQGVGSAYLEHERLLRERGAADFSVSVNRGFFGADLVHVITVDPISYVALSLTRKPRVVSAHFVPNTLDQGIRLPAPLFAAFKRYIVRLYAKADHLHVVNPRTLRELPGYGLEPARMTYIPNFVAADRFFPASGEARLATRERLGIGPDEFVVMGCGQVQTLKGVMDFADVARALPDVRFLWAGGFSFGRITDGYEELSALMAEPPANLRFTGIVERAEVNELLGASDLFFLPSFSEQFPLSVLEAASTRTPILVRDIPAYHEVMEGDVLVARDVDGFAAAIERLRDDPGFYAEWACHAAHIAETYSEQSVYAQWKAFYQECLATAG